MDWASCSLEEKQRWAMLAAQQNASQTLLSLFPHIEPDFRNSALLRHAAECGSMECVKLLLPLSNVKAQDSDALFWSIHYENDALFDLLLPLSDLDAALNNCNSDYEGVVYDKARAIQAARAQHQRLTMEVPCPNKSAQRKI